MKPVWKAIVQGAACGLMFGLVVLVGGRFWQPRVAEAGAEVQDVVKAKRFELVDSSGRNRAVLGFPETDETEYRPGLFVKDENGVVRSELSVADSICANLFLFDENHTSRVILTTVGDSPFLGLNGKSKWSAP